MMQKMASRRSRNLSSLSNSSMKKSKSMWSLGFDEPSWGRTLSGGQDKAKITQLLKTTHLEQLSKLQSKHQQECDLLDEIRNFGKQKSQIEKEYGQALQKLVLQYHKRDWPPLVETEDTDQKQVLHVWKSLLEATDKVAQARVVASDNYKNNIYEAAKNYRTQKDVHLKKCQELINNLQNEITETIKDLAKAKKKYYEMEQIAAMSREKYQEVDDRLRKNQISIFKSKAGLEKAFQKLQQKRDESLISSTIARNEYILTLSAANSHQRRYYEVDVPEAMKLLDGDVFRKLQSYMEMLCRYELDACNETRNAYSAAQHATTKISREYNTRCFLRENPIFEWGPSYEFEAYGDDSSGGKLMEEQSGNDNSLNREARKWSYRVVRDERQLQRLRKMKQGLEGLSQKYAENPELNVEAATIQETEVRYEKCKEDIRRSETDKLQCDARLQLLREAQVDVATWIESAKAQLVKEASMSLSTPGRQNSVNQKTASTPTTPLNNSYQPPGVNGGSVGDADERYCEDYGDDFDDTFDEEGITFGMMDNLSLPSSDHSRSYPITCTVCYPYEATRSDELTISVGDRIEVIEDGDLDQWVKAQNSAGQLGYVPENYLRFPPTSASATPHHYAIPPGEEDYATNTLGSSSSSTSGTSSLTASSAPGNDREVSNIIYGGGSNHAVGICLAKAIYEYEACTKEELTFPEGAIINILTKDDNGVDDGWWKGELNGKIGVFPGLIVELIGGDVGSDASSPLDSLISEPPSFRPPPPSECPPPPPPDDSNNSSYDSSTIRSNQSWSTQLYREFPVSHTSPSELGLPEIRHERANSAPVSPVNAKLKPQRAAPAPPQRPSFYHAGTS